MSPTARQAVPTILIMLAGMVYFTPEMNDQLRSMGAAGLWAAAMIWNFVFAPKPQPASNLPRIIWDERDGGEKFSIIMFHLLIVLAAVFFASQIAQRAFSDEGGAWLLIPVAAIVGSTAWLIWSNWKNRNAR